MANDLEQRRRAIAAALRQIMAEPLPTGEPTPAPTPAPAPALVPPTIVFVDARSGTSTQSADEAAALAARDRIMTAEWDCEQFADRGDSTAAPMVPPMEPVGSMSPTASMALFGHA